MSKQPDAKPDAKTIERLYALRRKLPAAFCDQLDSAEGAFNALIAARAPTSKLWIPDKKAKA